MELTLVSRDEWGALPVADAEGERVLPLATPVPHVIIKYHSKTEPCSDREECIKMLKRLEDFQVNVIKHTDIDYNFYIGGDGMVYEGRGWTREPVGEHELVGESLDICYMGDWDEGNDPPDEMSRAFRFLVEFGVNHNFIKEDYDITELRLGDIPGPKVKSTINMKSVEKKKRKLRKKLQK